MVRLSDPGWGGPVTVAVPADCPEHHALHAVGKNYGGDASPLRLTDLRSRGHVHRSPARPLGLAAGEPAHALTPRWRCLRTRTPLRLQCVAVKSRRQRVRGWGVQTGAGVRRRPGRRPARPTVVTAHGGKGNPQDHDNMSPFSVVKLL